MVGAPDVDELMETEDPNFGQVLARVFGIQSHEGRTYFALLDNPGSTAAELAEVPDRDCSNINRSLTTFLDKGLTERKCRLSDPSGYVYQYTVALLPEAKEMMYAASDEWAEDIHVRIDVFGKS